MMHYAETANCRTQIIRAYFDQPEGDPCLRCDNCAREFPDQVGSNFKAAIALSAHAHHATPEPAQSPTPAEPPAQSVTTIETIHGTIQTTCPETLLQPTPEAAFTKGDSVRHKRFGTGKVLDVFNGMVLVDFLKAGSKRLRADFLRAA